MVTSLLQEPSFRHGAAVFLLVQSHPFKDPVKKFLVLTGTRPHHIWVVGLIIVYRSDSDEKQL